MTLSNLTVASNYVDGINSHSGSLSGRGLNLWSYGTVIVRKLNDGKFLLSDSTFSNTTSKHIGNFLCCVNTSDVYRIPNHRTGTDMLDSMETIAGRFKKDIQFFLDNMDIMTRKPNRQEFRRQWNNALRFNDDIHEFIDDAFRIKVTRALANIKQD